MIAAWLTAFVWTLALELPVYTALLRHRFHDWWSPLALAGLVNAFTHPLLWFVVPQMDDYWTWVVLAETGVIIAETLLVAAFLKRPRWLRALGAAATANIVSTILGILLLH